MRGDKEPVGNPRLALVDRRRRERRQVELPQPVKITHSGPNGAAHTFIATLVDASEAGLGVEARVPLANGMTVFLGADLSNADFSLALEGPAEVVHSREIEPGRYRIGLSLERMTYRRLAVHSPA